MGFNEFISKLFGNKASRDRREIAPWVEKIKAAYPAISALSNDELRAAVDDRVAAGVDVVKVMASGGFATADTDQLGAQFTTDQLSVMVERAHRAGLPLVAHAHSLVAIEYALDAGVDGIEHFTALSATAGARIEDRVLQQTARQGTFVDVTLGSFDHVWAAAGHSHSVFQTTYDELLRITSGKAVEVD